jgi:hypothetical protein
MLFILTPRCQEAAFFVEWYGLKKDMNAKAFPVFTGNDATLCVCGENAAAAVGFLAGRYNLNRSSGHWLLPVFHHSLSAVIYPHTLTDDANRSYYPERLYRHPFTEKEIICPEAAAAFRTAARFFTLDRIVLLISPEDALPSIPAWITEVMKTDIEIITASERKAMESLAERLRLTHTMRLELTRLCVEYKSRGGGLLTLFGACEPNSNTKRERAVIFAQLRESLQSHGNV